MRIVSRLCLLKNGSLLFVAWCSRGDGIVTRRCRTTIAHCAASLHPTSRCCPQRKWFSAGLEILGNVGVSFLLRHGRVAPPSACTACSDLYFRTLTYQQWKRECLGQCAVLPVVSTSTSSAPASHNRSPSSAKLDIWPAPECTRSRCSYMTCTRLVAVLGQDRYRAAVPDYSIRSTSCLYSTALAFSSPGC